MKKSESHFLKEYLDRGFTDIYVEGQAWKEKSDWHATETQTEQAIAKKDGRFYSLSASSVTKFNIGGSHRVHIQDNEITEEDYASRAAASGTSIADTQQERTKYAEHIAAAKKSEEINEKLLATAPECPEHSMKMHLKKGPKAYFWGCPRYPNCTKKEWLTPAQKQLAIQLSKLPYTGYLS